MLAKLVLALQLTLFGPELFVQPPNSWRHRKCGRCFRVLQPGNLWLLSAISGLDKTFSFFCYFLSLSHFFPVSVCSSIGVIKPVNAECSSYYCMYGRTCTDLHPLPAFLTLFLQTVIPNQLKPSFRAFYSGLSLFMSPVFLNEWINVE